MSDFLTRLAERALGLTPLAQPWLAPRFARGPELASNLEGAAGLATETAPAAAAAAPADVEEEAAVWRRLLEQPVEPDRPR
ncbi:MAG TPA: hypothetical protein VN999_13180 [Thermoanaerobaculia bacterium]|nr:hypothetical protein [Thermoanaerobaculia bacterium]